MLSTVLLARIVALIGSGLAIMVAVHAQTTADSATTPAPVTGKSAGNALRVGVIGPFAGPSGDFGMPMLNGLHQAVDYISAVGVYLGRELEIVRKDDQVNPDVGLKMSQELVSEKVVATIDVLQHRRGHEIC